MPQLELIAYNLRSRENVGSLFRTADSLGVARLWLAGYTPHPPDAKISKVALGAEKSVPFASVTDIRLLIDDLRQNGFKVYALEITPDAQELSTFVPPAKIALILGTETTGIPPSVLALCDGALKITQRGLKESLNVAVAAGIAAYEILKRQR